MTRGQRSRNVAIAALGAVLFEGSRRLVRGGAVSPIEERIFRRANDASDALGIPVRTVMQAGTFGTVRPWRRSRISAAAGGSPSESGPVGPRRGSSPKR